MKTLPPDVAPYKRTETFTEDTLPDGLRQTHRTRSGVWGHIVILQGELRYTILEPEPEAHVLTPELSGVVEPEVPHEVEPLGPVRFYVEFLR